MEERKNEKHYDQHQQHTDHNDDENELPSQAMATHELIREEGAKELERDIWALLCSAIAAGLSMSASFLAKGVFHAEIGHLPGGILIESIGYTFGFIIVIMAHQQLFTENTITPVLSVMQKPTANNLILLMRLWAVVLLGNLIGTAIAAWAFGYMPVFDPAIQQAFHDIGMKVMANSPTQMFAKAVISGWIVATMVWMLPSAGNTKILVIFAMTWLIAVADTTHIVVGTIEILYLVFTGAIPWQEFIWPFAIPTLLGNICGGTFIFALLSHAQIRMDMQKDSSVTVEKSS
ncbi:formate/nitrite transporter family protein [Rosenbergiella australiborealis]|uniref:Formate/nitrite transporter family protein n=1 Tax=Rosenbergiella australiborealis TaxID=1544696 RepID=A0ABS5T7H4_9GAMM|nr:formate/nitrite transporter family protein [Rosenbergiella australiborealis]MBT0728320.1 formate/nitrite transporter family protein [Rosenbergiella australiborealis]